MLLKNKKLLLLFIPLIFIASIAFSQLRHIGVITLQKVHVNNSSVKVDFLSYPGAIDYRVYDTAHPNIVKYAGLSRNKNKTNAVNQIEWNLVGDHKKHQLIIEAVDKLGPVPEANRYSEQNMPVQLPLPLNAMLGGNSGKTTDGNYSINGQGPYTNTPSVLARSKPITIQTEANLVAIPSTSSATDTFFDTFDNAEEKTIKEVQNNPTKGSAQYTLNNKHMRWDIFFAGADTKDSMPFIMDDHFMDVLFNGGTPGSNVPLHTLRGSMAMSPQKTADFSNGKLLHATMEVDGHVNLLRWLAFDIAPADDPMTNWYYFTAQMNQSNQVVVADIFDDQYKISYLDGPAGAHTENLGAIVPNIYGTPQIVPRNTNGFGLDNRTRFDLFMTTKQIVLFEDGKLKTETTLSHNLPFDHAKIYFTHFVYPTSHSMVDPKKVAPWENYWLTQVPFSDERHWDNMGFEVLPVSFVPVNNNWASLSSLIHIH